MLHADILSVVLPRSDYTREWFWLTRKDASVVLDVGDLEYISSSGLRVLTILFKESGPALIVNASPDVYNVFDITGFTELTKVLRKPREITLDGCEVIGHGASATVYRMDEGCARLSCGRFWGSCQTTTT